MTNILNSHLEQVNNIIPARHLKKEQQERYSVPAPQYLPEYSVDKALSERASFRDGVNVQIYHNTQKKKKSPFKAAALGALICSAVLLIKRKIH